MEAPRCPKCGRKMVLRTARQGRYAGRQFWGCSGYPNCRGIVNIAPQQEKIEYYRQAEETTTDTEPEQSMGRKVWITFREVLAWAVAIAAILAGIWMTIDEYSGVHFGPRWGGGTIIIVGLALAACISSGEINRRKKRR